ncbi:MAG: nucleotide-diphospho-sugar transferase [Microbacter sp.]
MTVPFDVPILFQIYNSLETSLRVFEEIKKVRPLHFYLVQDGYRRNYLHEESECLQVREAILAKIDWECHLVTLFRKNNLGPGKGTADAIKWFFDQVEYGIVLEHDCLPHPDFFDFCSSLLYKYKNTDQIKLINGSNYQMEKKFNKSSYYFCSSGQLWGWAGWKRTFINYTADINQIDYDSLSKKIKSLFKTRREQYYWGQTYQWIKNKQVDTWDYQLMYMIWQEKGLIIQPNVNLISNIGFGEQAIHCKDEFSTLANNTTKNILPLKHPAKIKRSYKADTNYFDNYLSGIPKVSLFIKWKRKIRKYIPVVIYNFIRDIVK